MALYRNLRRRGQDCAARSSRTTARRPKRPSAPFSRTVIVSPDLINRDKERLIAKATQLLRAAIPKGPAPVGHKGEQSEISQTELSDLRLYD
jgi:hypothetical protein